MIGGTECVNRSSRERVCPVWLSTWLCLAFCGVSYGGTVGYWRFEQEQRLLTPAGHGPALVAVEGMAAGGPVGPDIVPRTGETNAGGIVFTGQSALRIPCDAAVPAALADGQDFTLECWLYTGPTVGVNVIFSKVREDPDAPGQRSHGFDFLTIPGRGAGPDAPLHFRIYTRQDGLIYLIAVDNAIAPESTYHIALSRSGTTYRVFIDGELRAEADSEATISSDADMFLGTLGLGRRPYGGHYLPANARMDEVRLSDAALLPDRLLLSPPAGTIVRDIPLAELTFAAVSSELIEYEVDVLPAVYDVTFTPGPAPRGSGRVDLAMNGREAEGGLDPAAGAGAPVDLGQAACPDGHLYLAVQGRGGTPRLSGRLVVRVADAPLAEVRRPAESGPDSGWELAMPSRPSLIPPAVKLPVTVAHEPQAPLPEIYVPSQTLAPYPERLNPRTRSVVTGIADLAPDRQEPTAGGIRFLEGQGGEFHIHHRRAGVTCGATPVFRLRMEKFHGLAAVGLAVRTGGEVARLDAFERTRQEIRPGRVIYELTHAELGLRARVEAVAPVSVPAYGFIASVTLADTSGRDRALELLAAAAPGRRVPAFPASVEERPSPFIALDAPRGNPRASDHHDDSPPMLLHDTDYDVLVGLSGACRALGSNAVGVPLRLEGGGEVTVFLTAVIDSPGFDEGFVRSRIGGYFARNPQLPESIRQRLTEEAMDTYARIVSHGDVAFRAVRDDGGQAFMASCDLWERGVYRQEPVHLDLPDRKLAALANLVANDFFPGIVQPPGLVHDAKHGDTWNYIFCYRHVHAASNIGLETAALDYMRLLSANQQSDGRIASVRANFLTPGHGTRFDASYIDALHHYLGWTGDLDAVRQLWPTLLRACDHIDASLDPDGDHLYRDIIHQWKSDFDNRGPSSSFQTAIVWKAMQDMADFAEQLGLPEETRRFREKAAAIHGAAQATLWSDEFAMLGPRGPLQVLRLHPQSLEVDMPVWTGLVDEYQAVMLTDWYRRNVSFGDSEGGIWMVDNDWWPVVWSQHMGSPGDAMMVGWALLLAGDFDAGANVVRTLAAASYRHASPGFTYTFDRRGVQGGGDPATAQGAFVRALVEGIFGVRSRIDRGRITVRPRMPRDWGYARFGRPGLMVDWKRDADTQTLRVECPANVRAAAEVPVTASVRQVLLNGAAVDYRVLPAMRHALVCVETPPGGGTLSVTVGPRNWSVSAPERAAVGQGVEIITTGLDDCAVDNRFGFFEQISVGGGRHSLRLRRAACGRAAVFLHCRLGNIEWIEPVVIGVGPPTAAESQERTVDDPLPEGTRYVPVDLSDAYTDDIQTCFRHRWQWDANDQPSSLIAYWTMPLFTLRYPIPQRVRVGAVPFLLGAMGPGDAEAENDLIMLANTPPRELPTAATIAVGGRRLRKAYLLSLNMNLPQKCYVPAAEVIVRYGDGEEQRTPLTPPLNFDSFYQDFGINTMALPLPAQVGYGRRPWVLYGGVDLAQHHLTMTDIHCDPDRLVDAITVRSVATETFFGLAGLTLAEVPEAP